MLGISAQLFFVYKILTKMLTQKHILRLKELLIKCRIKGDGNLVLKRDKGVYFHGI